jgi:hypothetical protein
MATYLYCIVQSAGPLTPPEGADAAPAGPPETGPPRLVALGDELWLVVGDAALPAFSGEEIERRLADLAWVSACAVAHERVVAHFAALAPVIPMKLFTLFASDERAVEALSSQRERLAAVLAEVAGRAEWGVRIQFDGSRAKRVTAAPAVPAGSGEPVSGRSFLQRKKEAQEAARNLAGRAGAAVEESFVELSRHAAAARRREPLAATVAEPGPRLLLDAAFLLPAAAPEDFERAVQAEAERLAAYACEVILTGPWPPYNFVEEVG